MATSSVSVNEVEMTEIAGGDVTSAAGFQAAGIHCGLKKRNLDLALVLSERPATAAGMFTRNKVKAAPVLHSQKVIASGSARAIICNSGNANACTGPQGLLDCQETGALVGDALGVVSSQVVVASTGHIGHPLDMSAIRRGVPRLVRELSDSGTRAAAAILTTDSFPKTAAVRVTQGESSYVVGGMTKGAGMIQPDLATTLCFITTDAAVSAPRLNEALQAAIKNTFNAITIDGDTSTNDCAIVLANGASEVEVDEGAAFDGFVAALSEVALRLAKLVVKDGEGATKLIQVTVSGASDEAEARSAAFTIANSPLVKTAFYGRQANWGRVLAAAGRADVAMDETKTRIWYNDYQVVEGGLAISNDLSAAEAELQASEVGVRIDLGVGDASYSVWTSDLTEEYIRINGSYIS